MGHEDPEIGRDPVAGSEEHHVPDHELDGVDLDRGAVAHDGGASREQGPEPARRRLGPVLLGEGEQTVQDDHDEDRHPELGEAGEEREAARAPEHQGEEVDELREESPEEGGAASLRKEVGSVSGQARSSLLPGKAGVGTDPCLPARCGATRRGRLHKSPAPPSPEDARALPKPRYLRIGCRRTIGSRSQEPPSPRYRPASIAASPARTIAYTTWSSTNGLNSGQIDVAV